MNHTYEVTVKNLNNDGFMHIEVVAQKYNVTHNGDIVFADRFGGSVRAIAAGYWTDVRLT